MKRFLGIVLAVSLLLSNLPMTLFAQDPADETSAETTAADLTAPANETDPSETEETNPETEASVSNEKTVQVSFLCQPADLTLTVYAVHGEEKTEVLPEEGRTYGLLPGTYCYTAVKEGYVSAEEKALQVEDAQAAEIQVTLTEIAVPETTVETVPETTEETVPETTVETVPETTEETVPETTVETVPETTEETVPETTVETVPETTVETVPETTEETVPQIIEETISEEMDTVQESKLMGPYPLPDIIREEDLLGCYLDKAFYGTQDSVAYAYTSRANLSESQKVLYDNMRAQVTKLACGQEVDTHVFATYNVSAQELGVSNIGTRRNGRFYPSSELYNAIDANNYAPWNDVVIAIMADMPYEHYWMERGRNGGWQWYTPTVVDGDPETNTVTLSSKMFIIAAKRYSSRQLGPEGKRTILDKNMTGIGSTAYKAGQNARAIASGAASLGDYEKMATFWNYIVNNVEYDYGQMHSGPTDANGSSAWSIINAFDNDPKTNIVCEGYAKAFQYLCDLSHFNGDVVAYQETGFTTGPHMWNIVSIDGVKVLTDVTTEDARFFLTPVRYRGPGYEVSSCSYKDYTMEPCSVNDVLSSVSLSIPAPKAFETPLTYLEGSGWKANIQWYPEPAGGMFAANTVYTAYVTVQPTKAPFSNNLQLKIDGKNYSTEIGTVGLTRIGAVSYPRTEAMNLNPGWNAMNGGWRYFFEDGTFAVSQWLKAGSNWFHFDDNGMMQTDWQLLDGSWYFFDGAGHMLSGWQFLGTNWFYLDGGRMVQGMRSLDGAMYYFDGAGHMLMGQWISDNGKYYYCSSNGMIAVNQWIGDSYVGEDGAWIPGYTGGTWVAYDGKWCYRHEDGTYPRNTWEAINGYWYYFDYSGWMLTDWQYLGENWFYFDGSGHMLTDWQYLGTNWFFFDAAGHMLTGWQYLGENWFCFDGAGHMMLGWQQIGGNWFYFDGAGHMLIGLHEIDGVKYLFNQAGHLVK